MKLFRKNIDPRCAYCQRGQQISETDVMCVKHGIVPVALKYRAHTRLISIVSSFCQNRHPCGCLFEIHREKSSSFSLAVSREAGRGGTRFKGS